MSDKERVAALERLFHRTDAYTSDADSATADPFVILMRDGEEKIDDASIQSVETWCKRHPGSALFVAQGFPSTLAHLLQRIENTEEEAGALSFAASLVRSGAVVGSYASSVHLVRTCFAELKSMKYSVTDLCTVMVHILDQPPVEDLNRLIGSMLEESFLWEYALKLWSDASEFNAVIALLHQYTCAEGRRIKDRVVDLAIELIQGVDALQVFTPLDCEKVDSLLGLLSTVVMLSRYKRAEATMAVNQLLFSVGSCIPSQMSFMQLISQKLFASTRGENATLAHFRDVAKLAEELRSLCSCGQGVLESDKIAEILVGLKDHAMFSHGASLDLGVLMSLLPHLVRSLRSIIHCPEELSCGAAARELLIQVLKSSLFLSRNNGLSLTPAGIRCSVDVFFSCGGVTAVEKMISGDLDEQKDGLMVLKTFFDVRDVISCRYRALLTASCAVSITHEFIQMVAESTEMQQLLQQKQCRSNLQLIMSVTASLTRSEVRLLSADAISHMAMIVSRAHDFPDLIQNCFSAITAMAEEFPYACSMILDYDFIAQQFAIPDTPAEPNCRIVIGTLQIMGAMVRGAPAVVTFEWVEILQKGVDLEKFFSKHPAYATALWNCIYLTLSCTGDCINYFFTEEVQERVATAVETSQDASLLPIIIKVAQMIEEEDPAVTAAVQKICCQCGASAEQESVKVTAALIESIAKYFQKQLPPPSKRRSSGGKVSPGYPCEAILNLWSAFAESEQISVESSVQVHRRLLLLVVSCMTSKGVASDLLEVIRRSTALPEEMGRKEKNSLLRRAFIAAFLLAEIVQQAEVSSDKSIIDAAVAIWTELLANSALVVPIVFAMIPCFTALVNGSSSKKVAKMLISSSLPHQTMRLCESTENEAQKQRVVALMQQIVINSHYTSKQLAESKKVIEFVDEFILRFPLSPEELHFLMLLLNYEDVRQRLAGDAVLKSRYASLLHSLNREGGGSNLALSLYINELQEV